MAEKKQEKKAKNKEEKIAPEVQAAPQPDAGSAAQTPPVGGPSEVGPDKARPEDTTGPLPQVTFTTFILSLASSALVQLGEVENPETGKAEKNLLLAKHSIDMLTMLREKVKNGLDADEERLLDGILYELRMKYVIKAE